MLWSAKWDLHLPPSKLYNRPWSVLSPTGYLHRKMVAWRMKFSGRHFPTDLILTAVGWYLRSNLSCRDVEELMAERGIVVDHSTINRWVIKYAPWLVEPAKNHKPEVSISWRLGETYLKVRGQWKYLYRTVDKDGHTIDFLLTTKPDTKARLGFLRQAIPNNCTPIKINIDQSSSNTDAIEA